jgi:hypothetical protein
MTKCPFEARRTHGCKPVFERRCRGACLELIVRRTQLVESTLHVQQVSFEPLAWMTPFVVIAPSIERPFDERD